MTLIAGSALTWAARQYGTREAVVFGNERYTFTAVERRANRVANALRGLGLSTGERVALLWDNSMTSVETLFGTTKGGLTSVPLNARHSVREHIAILNDAQATLLIGGAEFEEVASALAGEVPNLRIIIGQGWRHGDDPEYEALLAKASDAPPAIPVTPDDLSRLAYTSGTTGTPKGVVYTLRQAQARLTNFFGALEYALGPSHSMVHVGPLTHAAGNYLVPYYLRGARNIILPRFDPETLLHTVEREKITHLLLVPTMIVRVLEQLERGTHDLSSVTRINYGTAPIPLEVLRQGLERLGPIFRQHYGLTEAPQPVTILYPWEHKLAGTEQELARTGSCGRPVMNVELVLRDEQDEPVPTGEVGEITLRAEGSADIRYWNNPELTRETIRDGWLYSGDLGRSDEEGYLHIVGRKKDLIITGGFNVYSREVEEALFRHPAILEAAVAGIPDKEWGESICAFVVVRKGEHLRPEDLIEHTRELIASYKKPRYVEILESLPKNHVGKVDKNLLRQRFIERTLGPEPGQKQGVQARY